MEITWNSVSKDLGRRSISKNDLKVRVIEIAINCKYDGYEGGLAKVFWEENRIRSESKWKCLQYNIWIADLAEMGSMR